MDVDEMAQIKSLEFSKAVFKKKYLNQVPPLEGQGV
jgi:hypothetical protein